MDKIRNSSYAALSGLLSSDLGTKQFPGIATIRIECPIKVDAHDRFDYHH